MSHVNRAVGDRSFPSLPACSARMNAPLDGPYLTLLEAAKLLEVDGHQEREDDSGGSRAIIEFWVSGEVTLVTSFALPGGRDAKARRHTSFPVPRGARRRHWTCTPAVCTSNCGEGLPKNWLASFI